MIGEKAERVPITFAALVGAAGVVEAGLQHLAAERSFVFKRVDVVVAERVDVPEPSFTRAPIVPAEHSPALPVETPIGTGRW